ncbi:MAG: class I tRNA ligase family protein, partial [Patescibacteria group bacterium]
VEKYEPTGTGESPLAAIPKWVNTKCPQCGGPAKRETNTMPQWAGSNWYYLRYCDPKNTKKIADPAKLKAWLPVDVYVGGAEHAVLHLLYTRFIYKFLFDIGVVPKECGDEPFAKLKNQGLILGEDGQKMSKSRGNVVNPDEVVREFGADAVRLYEMFMGPFEDSKPWSVKGLIGMKRFIDRIWTGISEHIDRSRRGELTQKDSRTIHKTVKKVTEDIENFKFNTAISAMMEFFNSRDWGMKLDKNGKLEGEYFDLDAIRKFLIILSPFTPHLADQLWLQLGHRASVSQEHWPTFDERLAADEQVTYAVQVNGKLRGSIQLPADVDEATVRTAAAALPAVQRYLVGTPKRVVFVPKRLINFVV